jgi:hypothetical protein
MKKWILGLAGAALMAASAASHHGWGSYTETLISIEGPVVSSKYANPHGEMVMNYQGKPWEIVLAPVSRMETRGLKKDDIAPGKTVKVEGYARKDGTAELRAERIIVGGKKVELR